MQSGHTYQSLAGHSKIRVKLDIVKGDPMADISNFAQYYKLADQLIEKCSKEDIAETARLLALNIAHYQSKFGELPLEEQLAMINMDKPNEAQLQLMADGMEIFVGVLGSVVMGIDQERH